MSQRIEQLGRQLADESYAVWPGLYAPSAVATLRREVERVHRDAGSPPLCGRGVTWVGENLELSSTGLVVHKLLGHAPTLAKGLLPAEAVAIVRRVLGEDMHLELVAAVLSDHTRPFFEWHTHVGGIDDEHYRQKRLRPRFDRPERVSMLVYLDEMRDDDGQLLVLPRKITDEIAPPFPVTQTSWEGQVAVTGPPGTAVWMEQSIWHAVLPRREHDAPRICVGFWFAGAHATRALRVDESLSALDVDDEVLRSVLDEARG